MKERWMVGLIHLKIKTELLYIKEQCRSHQKRRGKNLTKWPLTK